MRNWCPFRVERLCEVVPLYSREVLVFGGFGSREPGPKCPAAAGLAKRGQRLVPMQAICKDCGLQRARIPTQYLHLNPNKICFCLLCPVTLRAFPAFDKARDQKEFVLTPTIRVDTVVPCAPSFSLPKQIIAPPFTTL